MIAPDSVHSGDVVAVGRVTEASSVGVVGVSGVVEVRIVGQSARTELHISGRPCQAAAPDHVCADAGSGVRRGIPV